MVAMPTMKTRVSQVVSVNIGSSSVRLDAYRAGSAGVDRIHGRRLGRLAITDPAAALRAFVDEAEMTRVDWGVHRLVHGGTQLRQATPLTPAVEEQLGAMPDLAPLHNPMSLEWLRAARTVFGSESRQYVIPDTAFFADLPDVARRYAIDRELSDRLGIQRFGFHGIAHEAMFAAWAEGQPPLARQRSKVITLQLGSGCSAAAIKGGRPIDTSMGFSPLEGLVMATRPGDLDPGILLHLLSAGFDPPHLDELLNRKSGLLGLSGISEDIRTLLESPTEAADSALALFCYRVRKYLGAYMLALGGLDAIVFGGGIGENAPEIRTRILAGLEWLGIGLDPERNAAVVGRTGAISFEASPVEIAVLAVDEGRAMVETVRAAFESGPGQRGGMGAP